MTQPKLSISRGFPVHLDMQEGMDAGDALALKELVHRVAETDAVLVEVGSWKGHSASIISRVLEEKGGQLYCVDHWKGNVGTSGATEAKKKSIHQVFEYNLKVLGLWDFVTPMTMNSLAASKEFNDGGADFVFLDADHRYKHFKKDLEAWYPKVKRGGIICGHDCEQFYSKATPEEQRGIDEHLELDYYRMGHCHPGVVRGLFDFFNDDYFIMKNKRYARTRIWFKEK